MKPSDRPCPPFPADGQPTLGFVEVREVGGRRCPETGLAVPECSCRRCLEVMLREFSPDLISGEIRVARGGPRPPSQPGERREAG